MVAELALPLAIYFVLLAAGLLWIALDSETAYIFDVFGKNFDYVWRHSGQRWKFTFMYGWRLLAVAILVSIDLYLSYELAFANPVRRSGNFWVALVLVMAAATSLFLLPWIQIANRIRFQHTLRNAARQLTGIAKQLADAPSTSEVFDNANYRTDIEWSSWHPKTVDEWPVVVPVAYVHQSASTTVLFPVDGETFLAWRLGNQLPVAGRLLPFNGPDAATFVLRDVQPLRGEPEWSVVHTELQIDNECVSAS